jgi:hypothetical protein
MAVNVLHDPSEDQACLYCSTSDWAFGPVIYGPDALEKAIRFRQWFTDGGALARARELGIAPYDFPGADGDDPRDYGERDLERLYLAWRDRFEDENGNLIEPAEVSS